MAFALSSGGIGAAFKSRNYTIYWWGNMLHSLGAWVYRLAVAWMVWELTGSTVWLGIIAFAHMLPVILFCPLAGATADRYGHQLQYMLSVAGTGIGVLVLALLTFLGMMTIEMQLVLAVANGTSRAFSMPSRQAFSVQLVEPQYMSAAIGVGSATFHGANFVGPAFAGLIISWLGIAAAFFYVAFTGVVAVVTILMIKVPPHPKRTPDAPSLVADLVEGIRYTARHENIRLVILTGLMITLFISPYLEMLAAVADRVFGMGATGLSILASASGCGAMTGGLWIAWRGRNQGLVRIMLGGALGAALAIVVFALSDVLWLSLAALVVAGFALVSASACASSLIQVSVAPALRARVMSLESLLHNGGPAVGALLIGWAAAHFGIQAPLAVSALVAVAAWLALSRRVVRRSAHLEGRVETQAAQ